MVRSLILLLALFSLPAHALTIGSSVGTITACGQSFVSSTEIIISGYGTASLVSSGRKGGGSSGYLPSGSNGLYVDCVEIEQSSSSECDYNLLYSNNDLGMATSGAYTSPIYEYSPSGSIPIYRVSGGSGQQNMRFSFPSQFKVLNGKYTSVVLQSGTCVYTWRVYGHEAL